MRTFAPALFFTSVSLFASLSAHGDSNIKEGDAAYAAGDFTQAAASYGAAVAQTAALATDETFVKKWNHAKAGASCEAAQRLMAGGNGLAAINEVQVALGLEPDWQRPQDLLAKAKIIAADQCFEKAGKAAASGLSEETNRQLKAALALLPTHKQALAAQKQMGQTPPADSAWARAVKAQTEHDWAAAQAAWQTVQKEGVADFPARLGLAKAKAGQASARQALEEAQVARAQGHLGEAQVLADKAKMDWPTLPGLQNFCDDLALRREVTRNALDEGASAGQGAKWDQAESAYRSALAQDAASKDAQVGLKVAALRLAEDLEASGRLGAALMACRRSRGVSPEIDAKARALVAQLRLSQTPALRWKVTGKQPEGLAAALAALDQPKANGGAAAGNVAEVTVLVMEAQAKRAKTGSEAKKWTYYTESEEANPDYAAIQNKLAAAEVRWNGAIAKADQAAEARRNHASGCTCSACGVWRGLLEQARQWQTVVADLLQERNQTEQVQKVRQPHTLPYTDENWQSSGKCVVKCAWSNGESAEHEATFDKRDSVRVGAHPAVGLAEDKLELPDEKTIMDTLSAQLAKEIGKEATAQAALLRVAMLKHTANQVEKDGDANAALELRVKAAVLLGVISPELSEKALKALE